MDTITNNYKLTSERKNSKSTKNIILRGTDNNETIQPQT